MKRRILGIMVAMLILILAAGTSGYAMNLAEVLLYRMEQGYKMHLGPEDVTYIDVQDGGVESKPSAPKAVTVIVNGKQMTFPDQKPLINSDSRTMVPVRFVSEALGAKVSWDGKNSIVTIVRGKTTIKLKVGENKATVNGAVKTFDTRAVIQNSRTMVPLRFVSETLGAKVAWDSAKMVATITLK